MESGKRYLTHLGLIRRTAIAALGAGALAGLDAQAGRVDCWWEEPTLLTMMDASGAAIAADRKDEAVDLDVADKRAGDFSLVYTAQKGQDGVMVGLTPGRYQKSWKVGSDWTLHLWMKAQVANGPAAWPVVFVDGSGKKVRGELGGLVADGQWHEVALQLKQQKAEEGFDYATVSSFQIPVPLPMKSKLWFDDVYWSNGKSEIGVTDKSIDQRMAEAAASRPLRLREAFADGSEREDNAEDRKCYDQLYSGVNLAAANKDLREFLQAELDLCRTNEANLWTLSENTRLINAYYQLGSKSDLKRLEPATEKMLLELLWERTKEKNDIALTKWSTWWMVGSENHDLNEKACNLVTSRIFMNEPEYASRVYPDLGHGDGHGYWFHDKSGRKRGLGPEGLANLKDGKPYVARDHYDAWRRYMNEYFAERAKKGFFLERGSPGYFKWTLSFILLIHDHCGDEQLKQQTRQFLDLVWADWAQEEIAGMRGGPKTRHHATIGGVGSDGHLARFYSGGELGTNLNGSMFLLSDYAWPRIVWEMALDRQSMGCYAAISRGIGEEEQTRPRPPGTERSMLGNRESRLVKYSWVTPDYILGTQMDHPDAVYNHLALAGRWEGLIVGASTGTRVVMTAGLPPEAKPESYAHDMEWVYHAVQDRQVLITQQARRWTAIHPDWYPAGDSYSKPVEVYIGKGWDQVQEQNGWVFLEKANAYAAVRVLDGQKQEFPGAHGKPRYVDQADPADPECVIPSQKAFAWNPAHMTLKLLDKFSPVIIEGGRRADFATLADFQKAILANPLKLRKAAVPGYYIVVYRGCGPQAKELVYNASNPDLPMVGGQFVSFTPAKVFDSPFIQADYNSGVVTVTKGSEELHFDFNRALK